jgi:hypothetical protein
LDHNNNYIPPPLHRRKVGNLNILTRRNGIWVCVIGIVIFLLNFFTLKWWNMDIDILGAMIFVLGLVIVLASGKTMKHSSNWLSRKNGLWLCVIGIAIMIILGYAEFLNMTEGGAMFGLGVFVLGIILMAVRWRH